MIGKGQGMAVSRSAVMYAAASTVVCENSFTSGILLLGCVEFECMLVTLLTVCINTGM